LTNIVDHGGYYGNVMQALAQWWCPLASSKARDVLHGEMCPTLHRPICMARQLKSPVFDMYFLLSSILL
jgi:hypothetical protein